MTCKYFVILFYCTLPKLDIWLFFNIVSYNCTFFIVIYKINCNTLNVKISLYLFMLLLLYLLNYMAVVLSIGPTQVGCRLCNKNMGQKFIPKPWKCGSAHHSLPLLCWGWLHIYVCHSEDFVMFVGRIFTYFSCSHAPIYHFHSWAMM